MNAVERAARSAFEETHNGPPLTWDEVGNGCVALCSAFLRALREPTDEMLEAAGAGAGDWMLHGLKVAARRKLWQTMLDAALSEPPIEDGTLGSLALA